MTPAQAPVVNGPLTAREALVAELLGDVDTLLRRLESLRPELEASALKLTASTEGVAAALDRFRVTTLAIADQAQTSAVDHIVRRTNAVAKTTLDEQTQAMEKAARSLFDRQVNPLIHSLVADLRSRTSIWRTWLPPFVTALLSATLTVAGLYLLRG